MLARLGKDREAVIIDRSWAYLFNKVIADHCNSPCPFPLISSRATQHSEGKVECYFFAAVLSTSLGSNTGLATQSSLIYISEPVFSSATEATSRGCCDSERFNSTSIIKCFASPTVKTRTRGATERVLILIGSRISVSVDRVTSHRVCSCVF